MVQRAMGLADGGGRPAILWSVAGFDPGSGAGVTADLQTFAAHGYFGCSAPTALTVQSTLGVRRVEPVGAELLREMLETLEADLPAIGVKIGMLGTAKNVIAVSDFLEEVRRRRKVVVVLDPVLRSSSGAALLEEDGMRELRERLLPLCDVATPNRAELEVLEGVADLAAAMERFQARSPTTHLVVTGGDGSAPDDAVLAVGTREIVWLRGRRVATASTHGTGCAFSSALLCHMVGDASLLDAAAAAKSFVEGALAAAPGLGNGKGPMGLLWPLKKKAADGV